MALNRLAGRAMIAAALITIVALAFHPSGHDVTDAAARGGSNLRDIVVHSVAIAGEVVLLLGGLALSARLWSQRELAAAGATVFFLSIFAMIIAASASGFIAPAIAADAVRAGPQSRDTYDALFHFNGEINQAFAKLGSALAAVAIVLWSAAMLRARMWRGLGMSGAAFGAAVLVGLCVFTGRFVVHGFGGFAMGGQLAWTIFAGLALMEEKRLETAS